MYVVKWFGTKLNKRITSFFDPIPEYFVTAHGKLSLHAQYKQHWQEKRRADNHAVSPAILKTAICIYNSHEKKQSFRIYVRVIVLSHYFRTARRVHYEPVQFYIDSSLNWRIKYPQKNIDVTRSLSIKTGTFQFDIKRMIIALILVYSTFCRSCFFTGPTIT